MTPALYAQARPMRMSLVFSAALKCLTLLSAAVFLFVVVFAQFTCPLIAGFGTQCHDPRLDIWMLPFFFAPIGIPAVVASVKMLMRW
jgi:hypothetical protein